MNRFRFISVLAASMAAACLVNYKQLPKRGRIVKFGTIKHSIVNGFPLVEISGDWHIDLTGASDDVHGFEWDGKNSVKIAGYTEEEVLALQRSRESLNSV